MQLLQWTAVLEGKNEQSYLNSMRPIVKMRALIRCINTAVSLSIEDLQHYNMNEAFERSYGKVLPDGPEQSS